MTILKFNENYNIKSNIVTSEKKYVYFSKFELTSILKLYSQQVSKGTWRDYALDTKIDYIIFSIYRKSNGWPIYQIIKRSQKGHRNKPMFYIKNDKEIINKSSELKIILSSLEKKLSIRKHRWRCNNLWICYFNHWI